MFLTDYLNAGGLILSIIGAYLMFRNSPQNEGQLFLYLEADRPKRERIAAKRNSTMRTGMLLIFIGFVFQFTSFVLEKILPSL